MLVKAAPGLKVPKEFKPRDYIEAEPVEVPETAYYLRRLADGDLVPADDQTTKRGK
jgi:hypothetical protein